MEKTSTTVSETIVELTDADIRAALLKHAGIVDTCGGGAGGATGQVSHAVKLEIRRDPSDTVEGHPYQKSTWSATITHRTEYALKSAPPQPGLPLAPGGPGAPALPGVPPLPAFPNTYPAPNGGRRTKEELAAAGLRDGAFIQDQVIQGSTYFYPDTLPLGCYWHKVEKVGEWYWAVGGSPSVQVPLISGARAEKVLIAGCSYTYPDKLPAGYRWERSTSFGEETDKWVPMWMGSC